ncbi:MAG: histidine phosphatase family protein [Candidatus Eremiobacteraeota bacterium]|nr:histidine phosphatase family protein [Candidatus Eremiobacteraeota bacterium]
MQIDWPKEIVIVRHAESAGNVARERALLAGAPVIDLEHARDADVPLSALGERQAAALGRWAARNMERLDAVVSSPYVRAWETAHLALDAAGWDDVPVLVDERLREKEFGALDRLTRRGIVERYPEQAELRRVLGKFYYRPPGGESWTDVILRVRSYLESMLREHAGARIAIVTHQVVVLCLRYVLERMTETQLLAVDTAGDLANCGVTIYRTAGDPPSPVLEGYNLVAPLEEAGEPVTTTPDVPLAAR